MPVTDHNSMSGSSQLACSIERWRRLSPTLRAVRPPDWNRGLGSSQEQSQKEPVEWPVCLYKFDFQYESFGLRVMTLPHDMMNNAFI